MVLSEEDVIKRRMTILNTQIRDIPRAYQMAAADLEQETLNFLPVALFIKCRTQLQLIRGKQKLSIKCYYG